MCIRDRRSGFFRCQRPSMIYVAPQCNGLTKDGQTREKMKRRDKRKALQMATDKHLLKFDNTIYKFKLAICIGVLWGQLGKFSEQKRETLSFVVFFPRKIPLCPFLPSFSWWSGCQTNSVNIEYSPQIVLLAGGKQRRGITNHVIEALLKISTEIGYWYSKYSGLQANQIRQIQTGKF